VNDGQTRGMTLIEVLIAVSLLSLLAVGILTAMRVGLNALGKTNDKLMDNRRVAGAQRILEQQIAGFVPVMALCAPDSQVPPTRMPFFQAEPQSMRFVSTYSLEEAARGRPQILEFQVIPGENGNGWRLVVNEIPYTGPRGAGQLCLGLFPDPVLGIAVPRYRPIEAGPRSFVLADRLALCRFSYLEPAPLPVIEQWRPNWIALRPPLAVRIEMALLDPDAARLHPVTIAAPVRVNRSPEISYGDN
jgi:prepilin-type N-terminal cleavage/methylation domain-containing protein